MIIADLIAAVGVTEIVAVVAGTSVIAGCGIAWGTVATRQSDHTRRIAKLETSLESLPVIASDVRWIKKELERDGS